MPTETVWDMLLSASKFVFYLGYKYIGVFSVKILNYRFYLRSSSVIRFEIFFLVINDKISLLYS